MQLSLIHDHRIRQFLKFFLIGLMNTAVDFVVLNAFIWQFGIGRNDPRFAYFKVISFIIASVNSFVFNKWWVFRSSDGVDADSKKLVLPFFLTSLAALVLNAGIAYTVFNFLHIILPSIGIQILANIAALTGTIAVLFFNFFMYKFVVFKKDPAI